MKTKRTIKFLIGSLAILGCFMNFHRAEAQSWGTGEAGNHEDTFVINNNETDHWAYLRLQTSTNRAWNMVNQGSTDPNVSSYGSLWWGYAANSDHFDRGTEKMRLYTNGDLKVTGRITSGSGTATGYYDGIDWEDTRGIFVRGGSDNAFFGLINRNGENGGSNNYNTVLYFGDDPNDDLEFRSQDNGEIMRLTADGMLGIGTTNPAAALHVVADGANQLTVEPESNGNDSEVKVIGHRNANIGVDQARLVFQNYDMDLGSANALGMIAGRVTNYTTNIGDLVFYNYANGTSSAETMRLKNNGNVGIGATDPGEKLEVNGNIKAADVLANKVILNIGTFPDYVFEQDYPLMPLDKMETYIKTNKHLPGFPSEAEVIAKGANLGRLNNLLVEKVEELTLYTIAQQKQIETLLKELKTLKEQMNESVKQ